MNNKRYAFIIMVMLVSLLGCQPTTFTFYKGASAVDMDAVSLTAARQGVQHWQDLYVTVDYRVKQQGRTFDIEGDLTFSDNPKLLYTHVRDLKLKAFFVDKDLRVVKYLDIARTLSTNLEAATGFSKSLQLPDEAVALTFGYEGVFVDSDPEQPSSHSVWKLPKRSS